MRSLSNGVSLWSAPPPHIQYIYMPSFSIIESFRTPFCYGFDRRRVRSTFVVWSAFDCILDLLIYNTIDFGRSIEEELLSEMDLTFSSNENSFDQVVLFQRMIVMFGPGCCLFTMGFCVVCAGRCLVWTRLFFCFKVVELACCQDFVSSDQVVV